jgi:predicted nucleic acid-binding protein
MPSPSANNEGERSSSPVTPSSPSPQSGASPSAPIPPVTQRVVSNTTPLITLGEIGLLDVLRQLYGTLWIPPSVFAEYQHGRSAHPQRPDLQGVSWVTVHSAPTDPSVPALLDAGERDAIALARASQATRILIDERNARAVAIRLNLTVTGSAGVLLAAKHIGIIPAVKPYLDLIVTQGRFISSTIYTQILRQAGE